MLILSDILLIMGSAFLFLFFYSLSKQRNRLSNLFAILCISIAVYITGYALELKAVNIEQIIFFIKMEYFGIPFKPVCWFLLSYKYYYNRDLSVKFRLLILIIPVITLFLVVTNEYHHLFYASVSLAKYQDYNLAVLIKGIWYYVHVIYSYLLLISGIWIMYRSWKNDRYKTGTQSFWLFTGSTFIAVVLLIYLTGIFPLELDLTAFGFVFIAIICFLILFRYDFLEIKEIIRSIVFSKIKEGIMVIDNDDRLIDFNEAGQEVFEWLKPLNIGKNITFFPEGEFIKQKDDNIFEINVRAKGKDKYYEIRVTDLEIDGDVIGSVYILQDITRQKDMIKQLNDMANKDHLTLLFNRRKLIMEGERELSRTKRYSNYLSLLMIDIDHFKKINDKYGHLIGDEVLVRVSDELQKRLRRVDIICRYGGEEFAVILPETNRREGYIVAENLRRKIEELEIKINNYAIKLTISIGIAATSTENMEITLQELINNADRALYCAKNRGRNMVIDEKDCN